MTTPAPIRYDFFSPRQIAFGWGRRRDAGKLARSLGRRAFLVWGSRTLAATDAAGEIVESLRAAGVEIVELARISREPEIEDVDRASAVLRGRTAGEADFLLAVGGGSAIDLAKAAAALATNRQSETVRDYLEGVGRGLQITEPPLPIMALPTTAGTGSEATKNAVISSYDPPFKKSLRSELMLPRVVLVDPELAVSLPPAVTMHTGMDAITQLVESYISRRSQPIPRALALEGLKAALPAIMPAVHDGRSRWAREAMAQAALLSGMALANSGLGMAHGVAAALGAQCRVPHGLACAVMLPVALRFNRSACEREFAELATAIGETAGGPGKQADAFVRRVEETCRSVGVPRRLVDLGVRREQIPALVLGSRGNSMDGNPRTLSDGELSEILEEML